MVRTYKRKTSRGRIDSSQYEKAARDVNETGLSIRRSASVHKVNFMTLYRYIKRKQVLLDKGLSSDNVLGYSRHRQVFSDDIEEKLEDFIIQSCQSIDQLTSKEMRSLAYIYAGLIDIKYPEGWDRNKEASDDWLQSFLSRRPKLSFRKGKRPGSRTKYDKQIVRKFFDDFDALLKIHLYEGRQIWAISEITVTTGSPGYQGPSVTLLVAANSLGETVPPQFIFPLPRFKPHFISQGPAGCIGAASPSSSVTPEIFHEFMEHFHDHVGADKVLVVFNSATQVSSALWDFCETQGITLLPCPVASQCLHPLEISVVTAFRKHYSWACSCWMESNPDSLVTVYDIPLIVAEALPRAMTARNIAIGFQATGMWPFDRRSLDQQLGPTSTITPSIKKQSKDTLSVIQPTWCGGSFMIKQESVENGTEICSSAGSEPSTSCGAILTRVKTEETMIKIEDDFT